MDVQFRYAKHSDSNDISQLIHEASQFLKTSDFYDDGWEDFLIMIQEKEIKKQIENPDNIYICAIHNSSIIGIICLRKKQRINQLFILKEYRGKSIGKMLFETAKKEILQSDNVDVLRVNSSSYAIPFYKKLGFVESGMQTRGNGFIFTPMQLKIEIA